MRDDVRPLGKVAELVMGQSPKGDTCNRDGDGHPLLNGPTEFGPRSPVAAQWTTDPKRWSKKDDTLFCVRGSTTGRMNVADRPYAIGRGIAAICGIDPADTDFIRYSLVAEMDRLLSLATGSVFPNLSGKDLRAFPIPWPDQSERQGIASVISGIEQRIVAGMRRCRLAESLAQGVVDTAEGTCTIGDLATTSRVTFDPTAAEPGLLIDHYSLPAFDDSQRADRVHAAEIASNKLEVSMDCVLVSRLNPRTNRTWYVSPSADVAKSVCSSEYAVLVSKGISSATLWASVGSTSLSEQLQSLTTGTSASHQRVRAEDVLAAEVADPRTLSAVSASELEAAMAVAISERRSAAALQALWDFALPRLLSGDLRVQAAEEPVEGVS